MSGKLPWVCSELCLFFVSTKGLQEEIEQELRLAIKQYGLNLKQIA